MKPKVCIPITAATIETAIKELNAAEKLCDIIELRIDFIESIDKVSLGKLLKFKSKNLIVTCRSKKYGGNFNGTEEKRMLLLREALNLGADFIDVEIDHCNGLFLKKIDKKRLIISYHNFNETESLTKLNDIYDKIFSKNPKFVKIVTYANSINDNFKIFELLSGKSSLISFCMGLKGSTSRILAPKYGSCLTYASLDEKKKSAEGQLTIKEMALYNISKINNNTKITGLIGKHAQVSLSKYLFNANYKNKNLNFVYFPFKVEKSELKEFVFNFKKFNFLGASVTIPHKESIKVFVDKMDFEAERIGAVNTLHNYKGRIIGYNTDCYGVIEALKEKIQLKNKKGLVIGAGGVARAIIYSLIKEGVIVTVANRTLKKAKSLSSEFAIKFDEINNMEMLIRNNDLIINATSVGMFPKSNECVISDKILSNFVKSKSSNIFKEKVFMDVVYTPRITKFINFGYKLGCKTITGERMLLYQALKQFKIWTKKKADIRLMERILSPKATDFFKNVFIVFLLFFTSIS